MFRSRIPIQDCLPALKQLLGLFPSVFDIQPHEKEVMAVFVHAGDEASAGFAGKAGFDAGDIRIEKQLIGG